tara:strand:- start:89 stop:793 length:705 start_codon:yes stop_codon:yes gene_type:complete
MNESGQQERKKKGEDNLVTVDGLGLRLKEIRERRAYSQRKLASEAKVPPSTIGRLEVGDMQGCYTNTLASLSEVLGVSTEWLLTGRGPSEREYLDNFQESTTDIKGIIERQSPYTSILLKSNVVEWTSHPGWNDGDETIVGRRINDIIGNPKLWISLSAKLVIGQQLDEPIRLKINELWKDVYVRKIDRTVDESIEDDSVYMLITMLDVSLHQRALEDYQNERRITQAPVPTGY